MAIDRAIIAACLKGEKKAQFALYKSLYENFMGLCMRYRNDKEEATASFNLGFISILGNLNKLEDHKVFEAWVKRILVNQMLTDLKKEKIQQERYSDVETNQNNLKLSVSNAGEGKLRADDLKKMLNLLPARTKHVFNLFAIDGFSHREVSEMLEITEGTSKWHVAEARKLLKEYLGKQNKEKVSAAQR